ncbi:transcription elongation factor GreA [Patescibacteria group bacterium AH-259-L07]|nr:transcription elongation factor GreA [Patescibacteria group bacterium AH-259-L07]
MPEFLTLEGKTKIEKQLSELEQKRPKIAKRIRDAKELGDLAENTEYSAAKEEQGWVEAEITRLQNLLRSAQIIEKVEATDVVVVGARVTITISTQKHVYTILGVEEADPANGKISHESPLGRALLNKKKGDTGVITTPNGASRFTIVDIN